MSTIFKAKERQVGRVVMLEINSIIPNKSQPRTEFDNSDLKSLSDSIRENGIIQPICVRRSGALYEIISGERRTRAAKLCGMTEIPCIIMEADDERSAVLALIENIQRRDLSYFEEAIAISQLITVYGLTQESAAARLGKAQSTIANKLRLLKFTDGERAMLIAGNISERQARALVRIPSAGERRKALEQVVSRRLNLEQTEQLVEQILGGESRGAHPEKEKMRQLINFPVPRLYINSINKIVQRMKDANISCETTTAKCDGYYEYTIKFPITRDM